MRLLASSALVLFVHQAAAQGPPAPADNDLLRGDPSTQRAGGWNEARQRNAKPMTLQTLDGPPTMRSAGPPAPMASVVSEAKDVPEANERAAGNVRQMPFKWAGKLFFSKPGGDFECSAQFISPTVILTAAHCVRDHETGVAYTDFKFELQYQDGRSAQSYGWSCMGTKKGWVQKGDERYRYDYAMLRVDGRNQVGNFGWHMGWRGKYSTAVKIGYPGEISDGRIVQLQPGQA